MRGVRLKILKYNTKQPPCLRELIKEFLRYENLQDEVVLGSIKEALEYIALVEGN